MILSFSERRCANEQKGQHHWQVPEMMPPPASGTRLWQLLRHFALILQVIGSQNCALISFSDIDIGPEGNKALAFIFITTSVSDIGDGRSPSSQHEPNVLLY
jgi:hypothetical protein